MTGTNAPVQRPGTALPAPIALAASFEPALGRAYGSLIGTEARARAPDVVYGPGVNLVRVAQGGRNFEYLGEDPHLASALVTEEVRGIQEWGVAAQVKHYVGNEQEALRRSSSSDIDERTLREIYLPAFEAATTRGGAWSVMCAYNQLNSVYACENKRLLVDVLKREWGFRGYVGSDYGATKPGSPVAGLDQSFTPTDWGLYYKGLPVRVRAGQLARSVVTNHTRRVLRVMFAIGMFDSTRPNPTINRYQNGAFARSVAEQSIVLLKNDGALLPLDPAQLHTIAIVGPYAARYFPGGSGSGQVKPYYSVTPVAGAQARLGTGVSVVTADGSDLTAAANLARTSDAAVVVVNDKEGEGHDRTSLALPGNQNALIDAVRQANPRTVVVLLTGGPVDMPWLGQVPAVLQAWYPGEEGGNALTAVLFGDVNPSGKLPISLPTSLAESPVSGPPQYPAVNGHYVYSEGLRVGYRWYDATGVEPLFPFGFGLSYTSFDFANLGVTTNGSAASPTVEVSADVTNTGSRRGAEVAQVYLGLPDGLGEPPRRLRQDGSRPGADPASDHVAGPGRSADLGHRRRPVDGADRQLRCLRRRFLAQPPASRLTDFELGGR